MHPESLGPYQITGLLGKGGMGSVYRAIHRETHDAVAVKALGPHLAARDGFREIESLQTLQHAGIVRLFGFGEEAGTLFYAMELVDGPSIEEELRQGRRFTWRETTQIAIQISRALKHAHDHGVIHRDIKPANILLAPGGQAKLADFGIARVFGSSGGTIAGGVLGTADYMSPEQAAGKPVTARCDQYSLGGVMYALLAGRPPFRAADLPSMLQLQRFATPEPVRRFAPNAPKELERIIAQLLEKSPTDRFPNTMVLARRLEAMSRALAVPASDDFELEEAAAPTKPDQAELPSAAGASGEPEDLAVTRDVATGDPRDRSTPAAPLAEIGLGESLADRRSKVSTYTEVDEPEEDDSLDWRPIVGQGALFLTSLAIIGLAIWWVLSPASADAQYERIAARYERGDVSSSLERDMERFIDSHPNDPRTPMLVGWAQAIELQRTERRMRLSLLANKTDKDSSAEQLLYRRAKSLSADDPLAAAAALEAVADLLADSELSDNPSERETFARLAKKEASRLRRDARRRHTELVALTRGRPEEALSLLDSSPQDSLRIANAVMGLTEMLGADRELSIEAQRIAARARRAIQARGGALPAGGR